MFADPEALHLDVADKRGRFHSSFGSARARPERLDEDEDASRPSVTVFEVGDDTVYSNGPLPRRKSSTFGLAYALDEEGLEIRYHSHCDRVIGAGC